MTTTPTKNESLPPPLTASMCPGPDYAKGWNDCLASLTREAPTEGVPAYDYAPGKLDETSPVRVWLQIDTTGNNDERNEEWPGSEHVTWQDESIGGLEIQYIRADLAATPPAPQRLAQGEEKPVAWWNGIREDKLERSPYGPSIRWGADAENDGHDIPLYAGMNPIHYTTQPPHHDRGANDSAIAAAFLELSDSLLGKPEDDRYFPALLHISERAKELAALTEAKQQGPGEDEIVVNADVLASCVADACAYIDSNAGWSDYGVGREKVQESYRCMLATPQVEAKRQSGGDA